MLSRANVPGGEPKKRMGWVSAAHGGNRGIQKLVPRERKAQQSQHELLPRLTLTHDRLGRRGTGQSVLSLDASVAEFFSFPTRPRHSNDKSTQ